MATEPRRVDPIRRQSRLDPAHRRRLAESCERLQGELARADTLLAEVGARRHQLARELAAVRDQLWPRDARRYGRRPGPDGSAQLPPLPATATKLWGRRLRAVCLAILRATGSTTLRELHALLHHRGYDVDSAQPVKALADALGYETDQGRARRLRRGVYEAASGPAVLG